jgi:predicted secreted protein
MTANIGYGTVVEVETSPGSGVFFALAQCFEATPPSAEVDLVDTTHFGSPGRSREFIPGLSDRGTSSLSMNHESASATDVFIEAWRAAGQTRAIRITYPNASRVDFAGFVLNYQPNIPLDDKMTATLEIKVTGQPVVLPPAAPSNTVLPAISGLAQTGQTLTAFPGVWLRAPSFAYQWQQDTAGNGTFVNISGATGATYVPVSGNQTNRIRVGVIGTNAAGSSSQVFSGPTVAVVP